MKLRMDTTDGLMYAKDILSTRQSNELVYHPTFPSPRENARQRLITRFEEIRENIEQQMSFFNNSVLPEINKFLNKWEPDKVIMVQGILPIKKAMMVSVLSFKVKWKHESTLSANFSFIHYIIEVPEHLLSTFL